MSTDEVKKLIVDGDILMQDKDGEISKIAEIQNFESVQENNQDDAADAVRYAIESKKKIQKEYQLQLQENHQYICKKMLGIERISRKRFIKLLMGCRIQRNDANIFADIVRKNEYGYCPIMVQAVIEWVIKRNTKRGRIMKCTDKEWDTCQVEKKWDAMVVIMMK